MTVVQTPQDPRLDWKSQHDPLSLNYRVRAAIDPQTPVPKMWAPGAVLDQGQEGACVGFGWTGELLASPRPDREATSAIGNLAALGIYHQAQVDDEWPGEDYSGTSVLAGAKVVQSRGFMTEYRWATTIEEVRDAIITEGPVVIGIPWYEAMYETKTNGVVEVGGEKVGGHCILLTGYHPSMRISGEGDYTKDRWEVFRWRNSWGTSYGKNGDGLIKLTDLADLLNTDGGEACVPMGRKKVRL